MKKYQNELAALVRCLASTDAQINLELQKLRESERIDTVSIKQSIEQINKTIISLQSSNSTISEKIIGLVKIDTEIFSKIESTAKVLEEKLISKKEANDKISYLNG